MKRLSMLNGLFKSTEKDTAEITAKLPAPIYITNVDIDFFICWNDSPQNGINIDAVAIALSDNNLLTNTSDLVFYNNPKSNDQSVVLYEGDGDIYDLDYIDSCFECLMINLDKVSLNTNQTLILASIYEEYLDFSKIIDLSIKIYSHGTQKLLYEYQLDKKMLKGRALELGTFSKDSDNKWFFKPLLTSYKEGLQDVIDKYLEK